MLSATHTFKPRRSPMHGFEQAVEHVLGADMRLLYGMGVPVIGVCIIIALLLGFSPSPWVVAGLLVLETAVLGVVLVGFVGMLNEDDDEDGELD